MTVIRLVVERILPVAKAFEEKSINHAVEIILREPEWLKISQEKLTINGEAVETVPDEQG